MDRLPRKLKKKYKSSGLVYMKKYGILLVVGNNKPIRSIPFKSRYCKSLNEY